MAYREFDGTSTVEKYVDVTRVSRVVDRALTRGLARDDLAASAGSLVGTIAQAVASSAILGFCAAQWAGRDVGVGVAVGVLITWAVIVAARLVDPFIRWNRALPVGESVWAEYKPDAVVTGTESAYDAINRRRIVRVDRRATSLCLVTDAGRVSVVPNILVPPEIAAELIGEAKP
ncbi:hypothetical protein ABLE92_25885 [Gordonia sp. VNQ95]|jgi:hypothetical protein|uniref:hypothetical protein n=1 Tax=Gordonia TaxID=2053 RepID=UPI0032B437E8